MDKWLNNLWQAIQPRMSDEELEAFFTAKRNAIIDKNPLGYAEVHYWKGKRVER